MNKTEIELEAENFAINNHLKKYKFSGEKDKYCFIAGATSNYVEKQKLEFAISMLNRAKDLDLKTVYLELQQKLSQL